MYMTRMVLPAGNIKAGRSNSTVGIPLQHLFSGDFFKEFFGPIHNSLGEITFITHAPDFFEDFTVCIHLYLVRKNNKIMIKKFQQSILQ